MKKITSLLALFLVLLAWNLNAQITTFPYVEDFEAGDGGWTVDTPGLWELGAPANTIINSADTGANAWVTNLTGNYADNEDSSVVSPVFDLSSLSAPSIEVSIWWDSENSFDGTVLQSSIDGGASWQNVGDFGDPNNWFNDDTIGGGPGGQQIGWTGSGNDGFGDGSLGWVIARHALVGLAGESNVLLRFAFGSDGSVQDEGFAFDSINIFEVSCPEPSGVNVAGAIGTAADINWTPGGGETMWEVVVQAAGTGAPSGPGTSTASNNPYAATGLTPNTEYEVYVRSDCSGEFSSWVGPINFITPCGAIVPEYNANMAVNVPDDCWDESNDGEIADGPSGSGTSDWRDGTDYAFGDSNAINLFGSSDREWLLSPAFDLSAGGYQLEVNVAVTNWLDGFTDDTMGSDDEVRLLQSIDGGATWTTLTIWNAANEPAVGGTEYIEDLSGVTGTNVQFAIWASDGATNDAEDYDFHVGKFRVRIPPACPDPLNLTLDTFSDIEAVISWTPGATQTSWEVAVQVPGTGIPAGPGDTTIDNPYTITGLTATTQYEVWVRGDCGVDGFSSWLGPLTFTTLNTPPPPPNGVVCASGSSSFIFTGEFDAVDGWTGDINGGDGTWEIPNDSGSGGTGADTAFSGASFMNYEASGDATDTASAVSPAVDLTTAEDGAELSFYMHAFGPDMGTLNVGVGTDPAGPFTTEFAWAGDLQTAGSDPWVPIGVNLDAYLGQVIYIEFSHTGSGTGFEGDMSIDLVRVETCGSFCIAPSSIATSGVTDNSVDIDWVGNSGEAAWEYVVVPLGTGEPTGPGTPTATPSANVTGLTGATEYEVWVRADCGGGTFSLWAGPVTFLTLNTPPPPPNGVACSSGSSSFIFTAEFDGVDGWTGDLNGGDGTWEIPNDSGSGGTGPDTAFSGDNFMNYEASGDATDTASAVSPAIDLTTAVDAAELSFYMHAFGADMGTLNVGVGTDPAGPFTTEFTWIGDLQTSGSEIWVPIGVNLDAYLGQIIYIEFSHTGSGTGFEGDMSIDYVRVETCGSFCIAPSSILTSNATQTTVDIDWTANSGEAAWEYVVVPLGTGEPTGSGTPVTSTSVNATGLTGSTEYEVWVRADCGGGFFSLWAGPIPFFTAPQNNDPCSAITAVVNDGILCEDRTFGSVFQATASGVPEPSCGGTADDDVWFQFVATSEFHLIALANIAGSTINDIDHSVYSGTCDNLTEISCTTGFAVLSSVTPSLTIGETYFIRIYSGGTDAEDTTFDLCITPYIAPENVECDLAEDYCSGSDASDILYSYNTINVLPGFGNIDCLGTSPNPTFNLLRINTSGDILIEMVQNAAFDENDNPIGDELDVDFILWGPYAAGDELCDATTGLGLASIVDCSYSAAPVENVTLLGAMEDEIYLLLITNFEEDAGVIQVRQTNVGDPGAGSTVADITVDLGPDVEFCGDDVQLIANSPSADRFEWYKDNFILPGEVGSTLTVTESDSYQVIAFNDGCAAQAFDEIIVTIGQEAIANPVADIITCDDASGDGFENFDLDIQTATILGAQDPTEFNVTYHLTVNDAGQGLAALPLTDYTNVSNPQQIWVRVEDVNVPGCFALTSFNIEVSGPTPTADSDTYAECDDNQDGIAAFDLPSRDANILGAQNPADFTVTYYTSQADAEAGTGAIDTSTLYNSPATTIFVRVESNLAFDCFSTTTLDLEVNTSPDSSFILNDLIYCDDASGDGVEPFELEDQTSTILGSQNPSDFNVTYHETLADAQAGTGALTSPYNNISNPQTIYVRVENASATVCSITDSFQLIIPGPRPNATADVYPECDNDYDGITAFDLPSRDANVLGGQDASIYDVSYYTSQADADAGTGAIDTSSLYNSGSATIYVRVESNVATNCFTTTTMELLVDPLPDTSFTTNFDYELCPGDGNSILMTATANNYDLSEVTINWYYEGGLLSGENSLELEVDEAGLYQIEVMFNQTQCMAERVDRPVIELETCVIPQGISPNNDGLNETFDLSSYNVSKLEIFNRHGVLVYSKKNYTNEWHGQTDDGDELPVGTYFYTMEYEDGKQRAAWVYIQREN